MKYLLMAGVLLLWGCSTAQIETKDRISELDIYWTEVSRCVGEGDFEGYKDTIHDEGILVYEPGEKAYPLAKALIRWKKEFDDTKSGKMKAGVSFRFSQRLGDETTAFETGMFRYFQIKSDGTERVEYIHLEALLVKKPDGWKIVMENQKAKGTKAEWDKLKK